MHPIGRKRIYLLMALASLILVKCGTTNKNTEEPTLSSKALDMAILMANSEIAQFPKASTVDFKPEGKWSYTSGLVSYAMVKLHKATGDQKYYNYAKEYADEFIDAEGEIKGYKKSDFNIDKVNSGKFLFKLYDSTKDERYKKTINILREQLKDQPRTSEGGFWHKKRYPYQMWLDGLYMGSPFYAEYAKRFNEPEAFDDVINQFITVHEHTYNKEVGLNYHGWDESKEQKWANSETGCSPHFWGRAMGWYAMAIVDVLDFIPEEHPKRDTLISILNDVAAGLDKFQDKESGLWYQVLDKGGDEGNYLEASASSMFVYALLKGVKKNYINKEYKAIAENGYQGILDNFIKKNDDGTISLTKVCAVAGLGGNPYRDGSYEYYVGEPIRDNDPKGVGPFILASLELYK